MTGNAINFTFLLLEYYKDLNIKENELAVILMIDHLLEQDNQFINNDVLALKMNLTMPQIDLAMTSLYEKKYIEFNMIDGKASTSISPIKKLLFRKFQESLFTEEENKNRKELLDLKDEIFTMISEVFSRDLSPLELSRVEQWIDDGVSREIIVNSIKDAKKFNDLSINKIDRLIIGRLKKEDNVGNEIKK